MKTSRKLTSRALTVILAFLVSGTSPLALAKKKPPVKEVTAEELKIQKCYKDYMGLWGKGNKKATDLWKRKCLAISFRTEWKSIEEKKKVDPFLRTQAEAVNPRWKSNIEVESFSLKKKTAKIILGKVDESKKTPAKKKKKKKLAKTDKDVVEIKKTQCLKIKFEGTEDQLRILSVKTCAGS
ncbi:hypothetical protein D3C87_1356840 [compost metagenome]